MKKFISLISSVALAATMTAAFSANAADDASEKSSDPSFYFKADEAEGTEVLKFGRIFVNTKKSEGKIPAAVYIKDEKKVAGQVFLKWASDNKDLKIKNATGPVAKYGATPYKSFTSDDDVAIVVLDAINGVGLNYSDISSATPMECTGETSDAYPLACFDAVFEENAAGGTYNIGVYDQGAYFSSVVCRPTGDGKSVEVFPAETSPKLTINAANRMLGDVNDDGLVDAVDSSLIMKAYAKMSASDEDPGLTGDQTACADVNGDGNIDAVDASNILAYYAYASSITEGDTLSLNNFIKSRK